MQTNELLYPEKKYNVILADPPWQYASWSTTANRLVNNKYETVDTGTLSDWPIENIAADDCTLFLWSTWPKIQEALWLMAEWGFKYKTCGFVWIKKNKVADSLFWGMGTASRSNSEFVLIGQRGKFKRESASVHQVIVERIQEHSQKPIEVHTRIEQLMGDVPRVELFARTGVDGWDCIGYDVNGIDVAEFCGYTQPEVLHDDQEHRQGMGKVYLPRV